MHPTEITLNKALELQVLRNPDKIFIHHKNRSYTYGEAYTHICNLSATFTQAGIGKNDKICLMLPRIPELIIAFLAVARIGALPAPVNYLAHPDSITEFLRLLQPDAIISAKKHIAPRVDQEFAQAKKILCIDTDNCQPGWMGWQLAVAGLGANEATPALTSDVAYLNFTTGTSGFPKGAITTHANIYWNTRAAVEALQLDDQDVHLCMFASFAHPHELFARALYTGTSLVLLEEISPKTIVGAINRYGVTSMMGLAPMFASMAEHCGAATICSLRIAESGGMFTRKSIHEVFFRAFGIPILSVWGSTETTGIALANTPTDYRMDGSMGKVCPSYQVKLLDEDGRQVTDSGEVGELFFKGQGVVSGYEGNPHLQQDGGWYASGDMARVDERGFYYFVERKSGMIKVAGLKVSPLQVELTILEHPKVAEAAVVGIPDQRKGAVPLAVVIIKDGLVLEKDELQTFCKTRLPSYMLPKRFEVVDDLPRIGSGKINKRALLESLSCAPA